MKKMLLKVYGFLPYVMSGFLAILNPGRAFATSDNPFSTSEVFKNLSTEVNVMRSGIKPVLNILIIVISSVYVVINLVKYFKGDRDSSQELIKVIIGIIAAAILLTIINAFDTRIGTSTLS